MLLNPRHILPRTQSTFETISAVLGFDFLLSYIASFYSIYLYLVQAIHSRRYVYNIKLLYSRVYPISTLTVATAPPSVKSVSTV